MVKVAVSMVANMRDGRVDKYQTRHGMGYCFRVWRNGQLATCAVKDIDESSVVKALTKFREVAETLFRHQQDISSRNSRILLQRAIIDVAGGTAATIYFHPPKPKDSVVSPAAVEAPTIIVHADTAKLNALSAIIAKGETTPADLQEIMQELLHGDMVEKPTPQSIARQAYHKALDDLTRPK